MTKNQDVILNISVAALVMLVGIYYKFEWVPREALSENARVVVASIAIWTEFMAIFWLVLWPTVAWCVNRPFQALAKVGRSTGVRGMDSVRDQVLLLSGPVLALLFPLTGWMNGYRVAGLGFLETIVFVSLIILTFLMIPYAIARIVLHRIRRTGSLLHEFLILALLIFVYICRPLYGIASYAGQERLEEKIGFRLAQECLELIENPARHGWIGLADPKYSGLPPSIRRLRPQHVSINSGLVAIELHGGFDHYGYEILKDVRSRLCILRWYSESGGDNHDILVFPISGSQIYH